MKKYQLEIKNIGCKECLEKRKICNQKGSGLFGENHAAMEQT